jgi:uncharacterized membrane protein YccC
VPDRILGLDSTRALIAAKSCVAIVVGYGLALRFEWDASSVVTTIIVLQTAALGTTLSKAALRMAGTLSGAILGLAIVASCAHDRELFVLAMALLTGMCVWAMQSSTHQYAWLLVVVTSGVVGWPCAMNPLNAFPTSVDRVTAVTVGVILSSLAHAVFWPLTAAAKFEQTMRDLALGCRDLMQVVRHGLLEQDMDRAAAQRLEARIKSLASSLDTTLQAARVDSRRFRSHFDAYHQVSDQLLDLSFAATAICDAGLSCSQEQGAATISRSSSLHNLLNSIDTECVATLEQLSMPRDGTRRPITTEEVVPTREVDDPTSMAALEFRDAVATSLLGDRIMEFRTVAARVRSSLAEAEATSSSVPSKSASIAASPALRARLAKSTLACLQVVLGAWFFIALDWPLGLQSGMVAVMAFAYLNAQLPIAILARTILLSVASALPLAAVFYFLVMPGTDAFAQLAPWLALLFLPYLYVVASSNPLTSLAAIVSVIIAKSLISVSTTPPSYDFASFANTYLGLSGGFSLVLLLAYLFETRSPRRGFHKLLTVVLSQSATNLQALNVRSLGTSEVASLAKGHRKQSLRSLGQLKKLAATVDYRKEPHMSQDQVGTLLWVFEVLVMRLASAYPPSSSSDSCSESAELAISRAHEWCVESLAATGRTLAALQPMAIQHPPEGVIKDLHSAAVRTGSSRGLANESADAGVALASLTAYYRSLAEAILDCQRELESVDWKRWCWNRF